MGCSNVGLEQTFIEYQNQSSAKHLLFLYSFTEILKSNSIELPNDKDSIIKDSETYYCHTDRTGILCAICHQIEANETLADEIFFNGKNPKSRALIEWWEIHKQRDIQRDTKQDFMTLIDILIKDKSKQTNKNFLLDLADELDRYISSL